MYDKIRGMLSKKGLNIPTGDIYDRIEMWKSWYRGNVNQFHYYNITLADGTRKQCERLTMSMAKKICEDFQRLLWSENIEISLNNKTNTKKMWEILNNEDNNFMTMFPQLIEKTFALGSGAMVEYLEDDEVKIDYLEANEVIPYKFKNDRITGMITVNQFIKQEGKKYYYTHLTYHEFDGVYIKFNQLFKSDKEQDLGKEISFEEYYGLPAVMTFQTNNPHFQVLKPLIVNNFDTTSPMGISVFANSIDRLKAIDTKYDLFTKEFELGKKTIMVDSTSLKKRAEAGEDGGVKYVTYFDKENQVYQAVSGMENQAVKEIDFSLRHTAFIESINAELNWLSANVGLGNEFYNFNGGALKTATEVISENSDTFRTKRSNEIMLEGALRGLIKAVMELSGVVIQDKDITIVFDDSIINDDEAMIDRGLKLFNSNAISKETFLREYLEYDDKMVEEEMQRARPITPDGIDFFGE